ncbi:hypothetical protein BS47DRAFT_816616 [Hydnum rufescens UP504]|uniref:Uncharacterized protein n=1 Tax=Hydnum rufescens UP504 TaxID=1448309 RepID=A0A9P6DF76_9AGAM|nr:hypothetical protein BS47DRAFT_816616 [Hydnum rufescens UP504]
MLIKLGALALFEPTAETNNNNRAHLNNTGGVSAVRMCAHLHYRWYAGRSK